jgi:hypothetical protein
MNEIKMEIKTFDVFGSKLYVFVNSEDLIYIEEYIETVRQGKPDAATIIKKYMKEINSSRIFSYLNQVERDLKPFLDALKRDKKIDDLLS